MKEKAKIIKKIYPIKKETPDRIIKQVSNYVGELGLFEPRDWEQGFRLILNLAPAGGVIEKVLFGNKDKKEIEKIKFFLILLGQGYQKVDEEKLDKDFLKSDDFYILFKKCLDRIKYEFRKEKLLLYRNFLINSSLKKYNLKVDKNYLLKKLDIIEVEHFKILKYYLDNNYNRISSVGAPYDNRGKDLKEITRHFEIYEKDLENFGFLRLVQVGDNINRFILNGLGQEFLQFINYNEIKNEPTTT